MWRAGDRLGSGLPSLLHGRTIGRSILVAGGEVLAFGVFGAAFVVAAGAALLLPDATGQALEQDDPAPSLG